MPRWAAKPMHRWVPSVVSVISRMATWCCGTPQVPLQRGWILCPPSQGRSTKIEAQGYITK